MGARRAMALAWVYLLAAFCILLTLIGCVWFRRKESQPVPGLTELRFAIRVDTVREDQVRVDLGVANGGSTQIPADSQWIGEWSVAGPWGNVFAQGRVSSLPAIPAGESFVSLYQWIGTLEPGFYRIAWGASGYGSILVYLDVQTAERGLHVRTQTAYEGTAFPPAQTTTAMDWIQTSAHDFASGELANMVVTEEGGGALRLSPGSLTGVYTSTIVAVGFPFDAVVAHWDADLPVGTLLETELRVFTEETGWSDWHLMEGVEWNMARAQFFPQSPLLLSDGRQFQYRVTVAVKHVAGTGTLSPLLRAMTITCMDTAQGPTTRQAKALARAYGVTAAGVPSPGIIPRIAWGADESYRTWAPEYRAVHKLVIHHTVTPSGYTEDKAASWVRAIYYYHAVTQGWGDIGYNYLVDQYGNIYEGRYGGPDVVGAHVYSYNYGTVGVGLLGTFGNYADSASPTDALLSSLSRLCAWEASRNTINPLRKSQFRDVSPPNIGGHRDYPPYSTTCPGDLVYAQLGRLRATTWDLMVPYLAKHKAEWLAWSSGDGVVESGSVGPNRTYTMSLQVRNSGWFVWPHAGERPVRLHYSWLNSRGEPVPLADSATPDTPLSEDLAFGQTHQFTSLLIRTPAQPGKYILLWDVLQEGVGQFHDLNPDSPTLSVAVVVADVRPTATPSLVPTAKPTSTLPPQGLRNGGFEDTSAWTMPETACTARYTSRAAHSGRNSLQTGLQDTSQRVRCYSSAEQTVVVPALPSVVLRYWYQSTIDPGDLAYVYIRPEGGAWRLLGAVRHNQPSWALATLSLDAFRGQVVTVRFGTYNDGFHGASVMFVDDVVIVTGSTPTPTSAAKTPIPSATPAPSTPMPTSVPTNTPTPMKTAVPPTPGACSELAVNGDLEQGKGGWSILNTPYRAQYSNALVRTGNWALQLGIPNLADNQLSFSSAEQQFRIPTGTTTTLSLWYHMMNSGGAGDYGYLLIRPLDGSWRVLRLVRSRTVDWTFLSVDVSHYAGTGFDLRLGAYNDGPGDRGAAVMYVDSLSVRACVR